MMADRRRRSPEGSSRRRKESRRSEYDEPPRMRSGAESLSSSSSSSYIDISRTFPQNRSGIRTFFTAPSERRRLRRRRSGKLFKLSNSSSSSINSDLAYGTGFLKVHKQRGVRSRKGKEIDREANRERYREGEKPGRPGRERRPTTDAEIIAVGAGLAALAREQNKLDLKAARSGKGPELVAVKESRNHDNGTSRGLGPSKMSYGSDTIDEDGWEDASESEGSVDSRLAFGAETSNGWGFWGRKTYKPLSRKSSIVDPRLFGPANSLHGIVNQPVGFEEVSWNSSTDFGQRGSIAVGPGESLNGSQSSLQRVYPVPTTDPTRFEAARSSVISGPEPYISSRPGPIPIQQPQPITPVSQSVYEPTYPANADSGNAKKTPSSSGRGTSLAEAALVGVAGAAVGAVIASDRRGDRKDRYRDEDRERDEDRILKRRDSGKKDSKDERRREKREKRDSPDRNERRERRRDKEREKDDSRYAADEERRDRKREKHRDEERNDDRDYRREKRREERHSENSDDRYADRRTKSETAVSTIAVDPFQYQVDSFPTPTPEPEPPHRRVESVPTVVTVEREPDFTRKRSSSIKDQPSSSRRESKNDRSEWDDRERRYRDSDSRDRVLHNAESIYEETEHSTAPIEAAAIGAAVAAVTAEGYRESRSDKRRDERRNGRRDDNDDYDYKPRKRDSDKDTERDRIQEEADRAYREIVMARKIASQVIRSRTPSPDRSVVDKYEDKQKEDIVRIVTPPGMEDHKKKGPYDAPNADFQLDHVLTPTDLPTFSIPTIDLDRSDSQGPYLKRDPDAEQPRPFLNLVRPTPTPSPIPEKQIARSEPAQSSEPKTREETTRSSASEVVIGPRGDVVASPTTASVSKGVTWGENETKHYEVESPSEHRDEFVSNPESRTRETPVETKPSSSSKKKSSGWGAIAAGIIGGGAAAAAASSNETSKKPKSKENEKEDGKPKDAPYEYRGVIVEPESPPSQRRQRSPPTTGPKPSSSQSSHVPGSFDDDLDFTATVAAGLQDTGFDPNIVINDPAFRRRDSPPGSNEKPGLYRAPFAETVSDFGSVVPDAAGTRSTQGFVMGEVPETPKDWRTSLDDEDKSTSLSKKEQKKREKASRRQSGDVTPLEEISTSQEVTEEPDTYLEGPKLSKKEQKKLDKAAKRQNSQAEDITPFDEPSVAAEIVEEPESYFETPKKSKKKKKGSSGFDDDVEDTSRDGRRVSVPVDAFDDLRNGEDDWSEPKKSKRKSSKRDSDRFDSPSRSVVSSEIGAELERSSSKKSKSKRKSGQYEPPDPTEVSLPTSTPSEISRDGDLDESRKSRKSSNRDSDIFSSADRGDSHSVVSADASRYDDEEPRKSKKRSSTKDDYDDTRSVASAPTGNDFADSKKSKKDKDKKTSGGFFGLFGSKSESVSKDESPKGIKDDFEEPKTKNKKSKRSSIPDDSGIYGDVGAQSVNDLARSVSNGNENANGSHRYEDDKDGGSWSDGDKRKSISSKKDSFLANAGTLGAGVGLAGAAVAIAAQHHQQSKAANADSNETAEQPDAGSSRRSQPQDDILDPEIAQRQFRPSIDPQYGDLLPLPPSDPASPNVEPVDDLPELPESRPNTPEAERISRDKSLSSIRRSQEVPMKSPSHSAVPLKFIMGNRSVPPSPGAARSSPLQSPAAVNQDSLASPRNRPRPTSWDSTKEYKPLYLVESNRRGSTVQQPEPEETLPALPPSQRSSRSSSQLELGDGAHVELPHTQSYFADPLSIDTVLASEKSRELLNSEQSTPKADQYSKSVEELDDHLETRYDEFSDLPKLPSSRSSSHEPEQRSRSHGETTEKALATAALVSSIGYFASSPSHRTIKESWLDDLPSRSSTQRDPSPVDTMTKDRSSYLLQSSPMPREFDDESTDQNMETPSHQKSNPVTLHGTKERDGNDIFGKSNTFPSKVEQDRERSLETLSGPTQDKLVEEEPTNVFDDKKLSEQTSPEEQAITNTAEDNEVEPADGFVYTKSKKDKKKGKKGKGLSRSSTQDDISQPLSQEATPELSTAGDADPVEEFSQTRSTKAKKKGKRAKSSSTWEPEIEEPESQTPQEPLSETIQEVQEGIPTPAEVEPYDEFSLPKSKKKMAKKKGEAASSWEPEEDQALAQMPLETLPAMTRETTQETQTSGDVEDAGDFPPPKTKGKKGKNGKKKSVVAWEPEGNEPTQETPLGLSQDSVAVTPAEEVLPLPEPTSREIDPTITDDVSQYIPTRDDSIAPETTRTVEDHTSLPTSQEPEGFEEFALPQSKKAKKKGKSQPWTSEKDIASEPMPPAGDGPAVRPDEAMAEHKIDEQPLDELDQFVLPGSKKGKKKSRKSQAKDPESGLSSQEQTRGPEAERLAETGLAESNDLGASGDFPMSMSKKGEELSRPSQSWDVEGDQAMDDSANRKVVEPENVLAKKEMPSKPTPLGGPGAWPVTPATPWASAGGEHSVSTSTDYFPSAAGLHSPMTRQGSDDTRSKGYFPSAAALLPIVAAGATAEVLEKDAGRDERGLTEATETESFESNVLQPLPESHTETEINRPAPGGFAAGYGNEQLSLAKQLQEEFNAGSKKTKGKKKRQSLPSTPDLESSRARNVDESDDVHPRARSLSIGPAGEAARSEGSLAAEERKSIYSQDQLEVARQLKAEFETGNKKSSKKDKKNKKRQDLSRSSTQDDIDLDQQADECQPIPAELVQEELQPTHVDDASKGDGFAAGYQEDQLSLARRLQAEFGSSKKKDKKKRRSASQTPNQDQEPRNDYFGEVSQAPILSDSPKDESTVIILDSSLAGEKGTGRDGLAVGYSEDQLELARQLKDEFGVGSKQTKGKKTKRQSLLRSTIDDDFSSDVVVEDSAAQQTDVPHRAITDSAANEAVSEDPYDEFGFPTKKSKGKKGKKRESLLRTATEDEFSSDNFGKEVEALHHARDLQSKGIELEPIESMPTPEDDFAVPSRKRSKKGKKVQSSTMDDEPQQQTEEKDMQPELSNRGIEDTGTVESLAGEQDDGFEFPSESSKKKENKNRRQSLAQSPLSEKELEDLDQSNKPQPESIEPQFSEVQDSTDHPVTESITREPVLDDASARPPAIEPTEDAPEDLFGNFTFSRKKSKKKRKSGLSTPIEDIGVLSGISLTAGDAQKSTFTEKHIEKDLEDASPGETNETVEDPNDDWSSFQTKKSSKKDKKRKSGLSTPMENLDSSEPSVASENIPEMTTSSDALNRDLDDSKPAVSTEVAEDQGDDWGSFSTKSSLKKMKIKRKSGVSTPTEEAVNVSEPEKTFQKEDLEEPHSRALLTEHHLPDIQVGGDISQSREGGLDLAEDSFGFVTEKRTGSGKRAPRLDSANSPDTSTLATTTEVNEPDAERFVASPVPFGDERNLAAAEDRPQPDIIDESETIDQAKPSSDVTDAFPVELTRKLSKKDKRKRQATIDANIYNESSRENAPLTSWADEVEEAEIERKVPVIQEIAEDESLSHIASTMEAAPVDDFSRPAKKGKKSKSKKRDSLPPEPAESFRPPIGEDLPKDKPEEEYTNIPALAATGTALSGAALLFGKSGAQTEPAIAESSKATTLPMSANEVDTAPTRKLSKKEKRKMSVDRRAAPREDIFDDPSLWEGAEPKVFAETTGANEDAGSDGFWSAPQNDSEPGRDIGFHEEPIESHRETVLSDQHPLHEQATTSDPRPLSPSATIHSVHEPEQQQTRSASPHIFEPPVEGDSNTIFEGYPPVTSDTPPPPPTELIRPEQQWNDLPDEYITPSSKKGKKKRQSRLAEWDNPQEIEQPKDIETPIVQPPMSGPPRGSGEPPVSSKSVAFQGEPPIEEDGISTPPRSSIEAQHFDKGVAFEDAPGEPDSFTPGSSSRYSRHNLSGLPVLREESPAEIESERVSTHPTHVHDKDEVNRDSAFVTESPIPRQAGFTDDHEHIRDSGVHLRDFSPAEKLRAPARTTDDALARLSWPAVDEETETVDLHRSQRAQIEPVFKQHHDEHRGPLEFHDSRPKEEAAGSLRSGEDTPERHHHQHRETVEFHDSHRQKGEKAPDVHRSQRFADEKPDRHHSEAMESRDLLPSQRIKDEKHTDLHRTQTIHRSEMPKGDSLVKQRVERIESPDFSRSQRPKEERYGDLHPSERPKAEKARSISDSPMAAGAALAGATLGFAAARHASQEKRPGSAQSQRSASNINRLRTPDPKHRPESVNSNRSSGTPPLRRSDRKFSGDLRSLSQRSKPDLAKEAELAAITASTLNTANPTANEGRVRAKDMADVYVS